MNKDLYELFLEDQKGFSDSWKNSSSVVSSVSEKSRLHRVSLVESILNTKKNELVAIDYYHAAMLYLHGVTLLNISKAIDLASKSIELGEEKSKWLFAAATDKYLLVKKAPFQKYGTQYINVDGVFKLYPIDPNTTDAVRAEFNVPSLDILRKKEVELTELLNRNKNT
jgi:hypothetical protein